MKRILLAFAAAAMMLVDCTAALEQRVDQLENDVEQIKSGLEAPVNVCVPYVYDESIKVLTLKDVTFMSAQMQLKTVDVEFEVSDDKSELLLEEHPVPGGQVLSPDFPTHAYRVSLTTDITLVGQNWFF